MSADTNCTHKHIGIFDAGENLKLLLICNILIYLVNYYIIPLLCICYKIEKYAIYGGNVCPSVLFI
jgi:hypothetical protein